MSDGQERGARRRRSRVEAGELVTEYETSGLTREEFCRQHGLAVSTLARYVKHMRQDRGEGAGARRWVAVELAEGQPVAGSGLAVLLSRGRRIEIGRGFDANTLHQLLRVLEPA